jgi:hypothetical protein|nr:MAG TPA: hypothetical protein [Bacteriophage sp.]
MKESDMNYLKNETLLRTAIANVAGLRGTKVKFKGFTIDSYRKSLSSHFKKLLGDDARIFFHDTKIVVEICNIKLFSDTPINESTEQLNKTLQAPFINGRIDNPFPGFFAYNAGPKFKAFYNLYNYAFGNEKLKDFLDDIRQGLFLTAVYYRKYSDVAMLMSSENRAFANYIKFLSEIPFENIPSIWEENCSAPYFSVANGSYWVYSHRDDKILIKLSSSPFDKDRALWDSVRLGFPFEFLFDPEFLKLLAIAAGNLDFEKREEVDIVLHEGVLE